MTTTTTMTLFENGQIIQPSSNFFIAPMPLGMTYMQPPVRRTYAAAQSNTLSRILQLPYDKQSWPASVPTYHYALHQSRMHKQALLLFEAQHPHVVNRTLPVQNTIQNYKNSIDEWDAIAADTRRRFELTYGHSP